MHLNSPWGVHVDLNRTVYVVDRANHRVQKWFQGIYIFIQFNSFAFSFDSF